MKKLMGVLAIVGVCFFNATGQYKKNDRTYKSDDNNERYEGKKHDRYKHDDGDDFTRKNTNESWGYDRDWNVVSQRNRSKSVDSYQRRALDEISFGIAKGLINRREANKLMGMYEKIERKENRFLRNNRINRREARELENDLDELHNRIKIELQDKERNKNNRIRFGSHDNFGD
jgi:hypothetical protein